MAGRRPVWQEFWDPDTEQDYYFNYSTGKIVWREPMDDVNPKVCFVGDLMVDVMVVIIQLQSIARGFLARQRVKKMRSGVTVLKLSHSKSPPAKKATRDAWLAEEELTKNEEAAVAALEETENDAVAFFFSEQRYCAVCRTAEVQHATFPCACNIVCERCYEVERGDDPLPCPLCMREIKEFVSRTDTAELGKWLKYFQDQQFEELMSRAEAVKRYATWIEYYDPESGYKFFLHKESKTISWEVPDEVERAEQQQAKNLRIDEYAYENLDKDFETTPWVPPTEEKAQQHQREALFEGGKSHLWGTSLDALSHLGVGVNLYFRMVRSFAILMFLMAIVSMPMVHLFYTGNRIASSDPNPLGLGSFALGNLGFQGDLAVQYNQSLKFLNTWQLEGVRVSYMITASDFLNSLIFLVGFLIIKFRVSSLVESANRKLVSAADYSVMVFELPKNATEESVRNHFNKLFRLDCDGIQLTKDACAALRKQKGGGRIAPEDPPAPPTSAVQPISSSDTVMGHSDSAHTPLAAHTPVAAALGGAASASPLVPAAGSGMVMAAQSKSTVPSSLASKRSAAASKYDQQPQCSNSLGSSIELSSSTSPGGSVTSQLPKKRTSLPSLDKRGPRISSTDFGARKTPQPRGSSLACEVNLPSAEDEPSQQSTAAPAPAVVPARLSSASNTPALETATVQIAGAPTKEMVKGKPLNLDFNATIRHLSIYAQVSSTRAKNPASSSAAAQRHFFPDAADPNASSASYMQQPQQPVQPANPVVAKDIFRHVKSKTIMKLSGEIVVPSIGPSGVFRSVEDVSYNENSKYLNSWVAEVTIVHPVGDLIRKYLASKQVLEKLREARAKVKMYSEDTPVQGGFNPVKRARAARQVDELTFTLDKLKSSLSDQSLKGLNLCQGAFVVFNNEESFLRCVKAYNRSKSWFFRMLQPQYLRFNYKEKIVVRPAPDPSDVIWENLETSGPTRYMRTKLTAFTALLLIALSFGLILMASEAKDRFSSLIPNLELCNAELPAAYLGNYSLVSITRSEIMNTPALQQSAGWDYSDLLLQRDPDPINRAIEDSLCPTGRFHMTYLTGRISYDMLACNATYAKEMADAGDSQSYTDSNGNLQGGGPVADVACPDPRRSTQCPCVDPTSMSACRTLPCFKSEFTTVSHTCQEFTANTMTGCYCLSSLEHFVAKRGSIFGVKAFLDSENDVCGKWIASYLLAQVLTAIAAGSVTIVNRLLGMAMRRLVAFEHHASVSERTYALAKKTFMAQFVNTALIAVVVSAKLPNDIKNPFAKYGVFNGKYDDFSTEWYCNVGVTFVLILIIDNVLFNVLLVLKLVILKIKRTLCSRRTKAPTQRKLNKLFVGEVFELTTRVPRHLTTLFTAMLFSAGVPLLYTIAGVAFTVAFWVDKYLLLRHYRKPPRTAEALPMFMISMMPVALVFHLCISVWMYGNAMLPSNIVDPSMFGIHSAQSPTEFLIEWSDHSGRDYVGIVPRIIRSNTFPQVAMLAAILLIFILKTFGGSVLGSLVVNVLCICRKNPIKQSRKWTSAFTAEFAKLLDGEKKAVYGIRSKLDKYSAFQRGYRKLTKLEFTQGWRIEDRDGLPVLRKVWTLSREYENDLFGRSHVKGDYKRTWEVINDAGIHTYAMHANPEYLPVVHAIKESRLVTKVKRQSRLDATVSTKVSEASESDDDSSTDSEEDESPVNKRR